MNSSTFVIFLLTALIGGTTAGLVKFSVAQFTPVGTVFLRALFASIILLPFVFNNKFDFKKANVHLLLLSGIFLAANALFFAFGIQYTSVVVSQLIYVPTAIIVAILGSLFINEKINKYQSIGLIFTVLGMSILVWGSFIAKDLVSFGKPIGNLLVILAMLSWSSYVVVSRKLSKIYSPAQITLVGFGATALISLFALPFQMNVVAQNLSKITLPGVLALCSLILFSTVLYFFFYQINIKKTNAFISSLIFYLQTLFAAIVGIIFFSEKLSMALIFGALLIIIGVIAATHNNKKTL